MASASSSIQLKVSAEQVWNLVGGFGSLPDWLPFIATLQLHEGGRTRHFTTTTGDAFIERLMMFDETQRTYAYGIVQSPFAITGYYSVLRVSSLNGGGCRVDWSGEFTPTGTDPEGMRTTLQGLYDHGLQALAGAFGA